MLDINKLSKNFGKFQALKDISLKIPAGSTFALLGPNGSGKTTLLKSLIGSVHFDKGMIHLDGQSNVQSKAYKTSLVYMPQFPGFLPHLSAREITALLIQLRQQSAPMAERLIEELEVQKFWNKPFGELSGGMKQKINIMQCFMFDFSIALLDEPTASLDPQIAWYVKTLIQEFTKKGKTIFFTSHIMSEVEEIANRMALINNGKILLEADPAKFIKEQKALNLEEAMLQFWKHGSS